MQIVVASGNIFRRELSVFVLSEAGHHVIEVSDATGLFELAGRAIPQILIVDVLLARGDIAGLRGQIGERSQLPILWMINGGAGLPELSDATPEGWVSWPYNPDDLLHQIDRLVEAVAPPEILVQPVRQRYAGDCG